MTRTNIGGAAVRTDYYLTLIEQEAPEIIHTRAKALAIIFYGKVGQRTGNVALGKTEPQC